MASLKDAASLTSEINDLAAQLHAELTEGEVDFERMVSLADQISEKCDGVASTFATVNDALAKTLQGAQGDSSGEESDQGAEEREEEGAQVGAAAS